MKAGTLILLTLWWLPGPAAAQGPALTPEIQKAYEAAQDLTMEFTQKTYVALLEREVEKKGVAQFKKPGKFKIAYDETGGKQYLSDGKNLYVHVAGEAETQKYKVNDEILPAEALSFLGGLGDLSRDFAVEEVDPKKWESLKKEKSGLAWLELTPLKKRSSIKWLVMGFDKQSYLAQELFMFNESGNLTHYVFDRVTPNTGLTDDAFVLKKK